MSKFSVFWHYKSVGVLKILSQNGAKSKFPTAEKHVEVSDKLGVQ
jgi:hypothetical protein